MLGFLASMYVFAWAMEFVELITGLGRARREVDELEAIPTLEQEPGE